MMQGKVALEEHVVLPSMAAPGAIGSPAETNDLGHLGEGLPFLLPHVEQSEWFESVPISEVDLHKIGRDNALRLLGM